MSTAAPVDCKSPTPPPRFTPSRPPGRSSSRRPTAVILIVSLILAGILRQFAATEQLSFSKTRGRAESRSTFGNMDSFALALLLGGLRGPLVMFLWASSESQKIDRNLEDFDTKVEWIRLLQPEFDTVHIYQIWNKAYNVSAMMASPANKYSIIMEALDYAHSVDAERPGDVNILNSTANVLGGKLGSTNLAEFPFYSRQFRAESLTPANREKFYGHVMRLDKWKPLLTDANMIRPDLLEPNHPRPADVSRNAEWNDGSELQYLGALAPFPYGLSPTAMSYNYAKRAEVAMNAEGQKPLQMSEMVVDSRPGIQLKAWMEDESHMGREQESAAFGIPAVAGKADPAVDAVSPSDTLKDRAALDAAIYYFDSAVRVSRLGVTEYLRHLNKPEFAMRSAIYRSHIADLTAGEAMYQADHDYLIACLLSDKSERNALLLKASENYSKAMIIYEHTVLDYFMEDEGLFPAAPNAPRVLPANIRNKNDVAKLSDDLVSNAYDKATGIVSHMALGAQVYRDERGQYASQIQRCRTRMNLIHDERQK
jgi:hypothetical protein